jgi:hypothetical protein
LPALRRGLTHRKAIVRQQCVRLFDQLVDEESLPELVLALDDEDPRVCARALHALACDRCKQNECRPGEDLWVPRALDFLRNHANPDVRAAAIDALGKVASRRPDVAAALLEAADSEPDVGLRGMARRRAHPIHFAAVARWEAIEQAEPEFAARVQRLFEAGRHKTIATLRADGSPRISGIECEFEDGDVRFGSMTGARKGADLQRDPRFALHGPTFHPEEGKESDWPGEAKIAGRAIPAGPVTTDETSEQQPEGEMFVADITEVVITGLNPEATKLVVESWTAERGLQRVERD